MNNNQKNLGLERLYGTRARNAGNAGNAGLHVRTKKNKNNERKHLSSIYSRKKSYLAKNSQSKKSHSHLWNIPKHLKEEITVIESFLSGTRTKSLIEFIKVNYKNKGNLMNDSQPYYFVKKTQTLIVPDITGENEGKEFRFNIEHRIYYMLRQFIIRNISSHVISGGEYDVDDSSGNIKLTVYNETFNTDIYHRRFLSDFIPENIDKPDFEYALINILFQIVYTLRCFNLINLTHNDLHGGNILIFIDKEYNIFTPDFKFEKYNKYTFDGHQIELLDIGIYAFIFDFDGANKNTAPAPVAESLRIEIRQPNYGDAFLDIIYNNNNNNYSDLYKLLFSIINKILNLIKSSSSDITLINNIKQKIKSFLELLGYFLYIKFPIPIEEQSKLFVDYSRGLIRYTDDISFKIFTYLLTVFDKQKLINFDHPLDDPGNSKEEIDGFIELNTIELDTKISAKTKFKITKLIILECLKNYGILSTDRQTFIPAQNTMMEPKRFLLYISDVLNRLQTEIKANPKFINPLSPNLKEENTFSTDNIFN